MDNKARFDFAGRFLYTHSNRVLAQFIYSVSASLCFDRTLYPEVFEGQTNLEPDPRIGSCSVVLLS